MSSQYMPKYKESRVHDHNTNHVIKDPRVCPCKGWEFVGQYFSYAGYEFHNTERDFCIFHDVTLKYEMQEASVDYEEIVDADKIPYGATVLYHIKPQMIKPLAPNPVVVPPISQNQQHKTKTTAQTKPVVVPAVVRAPPINASDLVLPAHLREGHSMPVNRPAPVPPKPVVPIIDTKPDSTPPAVSVSKPIRGTPAPQPAPAEWDNNGPVIIPDMSAPAPVPPPPISVDAKPITKNTSTSLPPVPVADDKVCVRRMKIIGPINANAHFEKLYLNRITRQGILERANPTRDPNKKVIKISLFTDGRLPIPRIIGEGDQKVEIKIEPREEVKKEDDDE